jgi:hypothetical protein
LQPQILVVADPPHGDMDIDAVAATLGLAVDIARLKVAFPAPEVLSASNQYRANEVADALSDAGLSVRVFDGALLGSVPWGTPVSTFAFGDEGLRVRAGGEEAEIPSDEPVLAVYCEPPVGFQAPFSRRTRGASPGLSFAEDMEWVPRLDLYFERDGVLDRVMLVPGVTDFSRVADARSGDDLASLRATVAECERRFTDLHLDARLEHVRPRQRFVMGETGFDIDLRKLYSFGTLLLRQVLDSVSPELRDLPQYELGSRMSYVLEPLR